MTFTLTVLLSQSHAPPPTTAIRTRNATMVNAREPRDALRRLGRLRGVGRLVGVAEARPERSLDGLRGLVLLVFIRSIRETRVIR